MILYNIKLLYILKTTKDLVWGVLFKQIRDTQQSSEKNACWINENTGSGCFLALKIVVSWNSSRKYEVITDQEVSNMSVKYYPTVNNKNKFEENKVLNVFTE